MMIFFWEEIRISIHYELIREWAGNDHKLSYFNYFSIFLLFDLSNKVLSYYLEDQVTQLFNLLKVYYENLKTI